MNSTMDLNIMITISKTSVTDKGLVNKALPRIDYSDSFTGEYINSSKGTIETIA